MEAEASETALLPFILKNGRVDEMKKHIFSFICILIFSVIAAAAEAAEIQITAPGQYETEIVSGRDFYVIGTIKRDNSAAEEPLNIKAELIDEWENTVREVESSVAPDGITLGALLDTYYELGESKNDKTGALLITYVPPELIYNGTDKQSIYNAENKIVVKEDYFAAIICGGGESVGSYYIDSEGKEKITRLKEGKYTLRITALNRDNDAVCTAEREIVISGEKPRLIYNREYIGEDIYSFAEENGETIAQSIPGLWKPSRFMDAPKSFSYSIPAYYRINAEEEYKNSKSVDIVLYALDTSDNEINQALGSALLENSEAELTYSYYDIGAPEIEYDFAANHFKREGQLVSSPDGKFVKPLRSTVFYGDESHEDFDIDNGIVLTEGCKSVISGVFSPSELKASYDSGNYKISDKTDSIKAVITDKKNKVLYETECEPYVIRKNDDGNNMVCRYEFELEITPDEITVSDDLSLIISACDADGNILAASDKIPCSIKSNKAFIEGYTDSYWGKTFCDTVNVFGNSSEDALNADDVILRGDFAAMVNRVFGFAAKGDSVFIDIEKDSVYYNDILTAYAQGFMMGDEERRVKADQPITREEAIIILARLCGAENTGLQKTFKDSDDISFWAKDSVEAMISTGIISGFDGYLHPRENITVAESAALILKTVIWMNSDKTDETISLPESDIKIPENKDVDLSEVELSPLVIEGAVTEKTLRDIITNELVVFDALSEYINLNCPNGLYVKRVGNGLEVRNYLTGDAVDLSDDAVRIIGEMTKRTPGLLIKYNPNTDENIYFAYGKNENNKEFGIAYSEEINEEGREFESLFGKWYLYNNK